MGKAKTHQGAAKRIKVTGSGKLLRRHQMISHLRMKKRSKRMRVLKVPASVHPADLKRVERLIPFKG
ncbi:MAG: 50S ribosomal protein L35 [Armatimonadota bacterium]|nr:50S ribosomal protein L35 [Armatimonadota bacterium]MDR5702691.1 50S ribosomal protein L35 [Armatimonadota bacterium]MDR7433800.1 50S ribosomal protein L35 [Armatimonadota bacterium]